MTSKITKAEFHIDPRCGSQGVDEDGHCLRCGLYVDDDSPENCPQGFLTGDLNDLRLRFAALQDENHRLMSATNAQVMTINRLRENLQTVITELATTKADLDNERAVRSRRELAVTRAIAKANAYRHPGTNAGTHGVLSEMVEILEGK